MWFDKKAESKTETMTDANILPPDAMRLTADFMKTFDEEEDDTVFIPDKVNQIYINHVIYYRKIKKIGILYINYNIYIETTTKWR